MSEPQAMFFKISENGELEWRKRLWDPDFYEYPTYFNSIVSNGTDRYFGVGGDSGDPVYFYELDENCNVLTYTLLIHILFYIVYLYKLLLILLNLYLHHSLLFFLNLVY